MEEALRCVPEAQQLELLRFPHWFARPVKTSHSRMSPAVVVPYGTATSRTRGLTPCDMAGGGVGRWLSPQHVQRPGSGLERYVHRRLVTPASARCLLTCRPTTVANLTGTALPICRALEFRLPANR